MLLDDITLNAVASSEEITVHKKPHGQTCSLSPSAPAIALAN